MNKKGLVSMTVIYSFLIMFLIIVTGIMGIYSQKVRMIDALTRKIKENIYNTSKIEDEYILTNYLINNINDSTKVQGLYQISQAATGQQDYATVEYRFQGSNDNVNNWVYFNCTNYTGTLDTGKEVSVHDNTKQCEKWRIIGLFQTEDGGDYHLKIIRNDRIDPGTGTNSYDSWCWSANQSTPNWENADLQKYLNNTTTGSFNLTGTATDYNGYLGTLSSASQNMIYETKWYLGNVTYNLTTLKTYQNERGTSVYSGNPTNWTGKIGLMYGSDYGYASSGCYSSTTTLHDYDSSTCTSSNWMFKGMYEWAISPSTYLSGEAVAVLGNGCVGVSIVVDNRRGVRPVTYLKSNVSIGSGSGTEASPYMLNINS